MIKNLSELETSLGLKAGDFKAMYDDAAEKEIDLASLTILKKDDYETRIKNEKKNAAEAALEVAVKEARKSKGLEFTGKTIDNLLDAFATKTLADAKVEPDKKVAELQKDFDAMKGNFDRATQEKTQLEATFKQKENQRTIRDTVYGKIPENTLIPKEDVLNLFITKNNIELTDAGIVFKKGEDILKNKTTLAPLTIDEIMPDFITPYVKPASGGAGGVDRTGAGSKGSYESFVEEMAKAGASEGTSKFVEEMKKRIKDKTLVM